MLNHNDLESTLQYYFKNKTIRKKRNHPMNSSVVVKKLVENSIDLQSRNQCDELGVETSSSNIKEKLKKAKNETSNIKYRYNELKAQN